MQPVVTRSPQTTASLSVRCNRNCTALTTSLPRFLVSAEVSVMFRLPSRIGSTYTCTDSRPCRSVPSRSGVVVEPNSEHTSAATELPSRVTSGSELKIHGSPWLAVTGSERLKDPSNPVTSGKDARNWTAPVAMSSMHG